jgi:N-acetylated-alpha-linked acidic dipeptidase
MSLPVRALAIPAASFILLAAAARVDGDLRGYTAESSRIERDWETKFRALPEPARMREAMRRLTLRPHHVGSPYDKNNAEWLRDQFKSY